MSDLFKYKKEIEDLNAQRTAIVNEMNALSNAVKSESREFTEEELERFDRCDSDQKKLADKIQTLQRVERASALVKQDKPSHEVREYNPRRPVTMTEQRDAFRAWCLNQSGHRANITRSMAEAVERCGFNMDDSRYSLTLQRDQSGVVAEGGYTKNSALFDGLEAKLKAFGGVRENATVKSVPKGIGVFYATRDSTSQKAVIQSAENDSVSNVSVTYGTLPIAIYTWNSGVFPVSLQILQDSEINFEQEVQDVLVERFARAWNDYYTDGTGTGEPHGVLASSTEGKEAAATGAVTYAELVDLYHSLDPLYRSNAKFMLNDSTFAALRKLEDGNERPIFGTGWLQDGPPNTLLGKPVIINNDMPSMAAGEKAILFGDFSKYHILEAKDIQVIVLREALIQSNLAVGFIAYARTGARLVQPAAMNHLVMAAGGS